MNINTYRLKYIPEILRWFPPEMPGKARLARTLLGPSLGARDVKISGRRGIEFIAPSLQESVGFHLLVDGVYESELLGFMLDKLQPKAAGATFIDVGANIGSFTLPVAKSLGAGGRVIAIESSPTIFPYLKRNVELNGLSNISLAQCAASDVDLQEVPFYEAPIDSFGMGSLGAQFNGKPIPVITRTLDSILAEHGVDRVDLIKVDVEGFEVGVFRGAKKLLNGPGAPLIVFEFCDWAEDRVPGGQRGDAQRVLRDYGYRIWKLSDLLRGKQPLADVLTAGFETLVAIKN
ncbi:MAG TPA: FkbM family methyltransferase [Blastocatellia bacterium]